MDEEIFGQVLNRYKEAVELVTLDSCRLDVFDLLQTEIQYLLPDGALRQVLDQYQKNAMKRGSCALHPLRPYSSHGLRETGTVYVKERACGGSGSLQAMAGSMLEVQHGRFPAVSPVGDREKRGKREDCVLEKGRLLPFFFVGNLLGNGVLHLMRDFMAIYGRD